MKNWIVCAEITDAARAVIEANGGTVEVLRESEPHLELVTITDALYRGRKQEDGYFAWTLSRQDYGHSGDGSGICYWDEAPEGLVVYRWNGSEPDDPRLLAGLEDEPLDPVEED